MKQNEVDSLNNAIEIPFLVHRYYLAMKVEETFIFSLPKLDNKQK